MLVQLSQSLEVAVPENGAAIDPPDALVYQNESVQDSLFQFKVPPPENPAKRAKHSAKNQLGTLSISTGKSSRAESIARKRKAEDTIKKNTAGILFLIDAKLHLLFEIYVKTFRRTR